jgi:hypothetical protein
VSLVVISAFFAGGAAGAAGYARLGYTVLYVLSAGVVLGGLLNILLWLRTQHQSAKI